MPSCLPPSLHRSPNAASLVALQVLPSDASGHLSHHGQRVSRRGNKTLSLSWLPLSGCTYLLFCHQIPLHLSWLIVSHPFLFFVCHFTYRVLSGFHVFLKRTFSIPPISFLHQGWVLRGGQVWVGKNWKLHHHCSTSTLSKGEISLNQVGRLKTGLLPLSSTWSSFLLQLHAPARSLAFFSTNGHEYFILQVIFITSSLHPDFSTWIMKMFEWILKDWPAETFLLSAFLSYRKTSHKRPHQTMHI